MRRRSFKRKNWRTSFRAPSKNLCISVLNHLIQIRCLTLYWDFPTSASILGATRPKIDNRGLNMIRKLSFTLTLLLCALTAGAQDNTPDNATAPPPPRRGGMPPCLQYAGVSSSQFDQLRSIAQEARSEVQNVCSNESLTPPQKRQQIEDIHQQYHEKMAGVVSPDQRRSFMACRARHGDRRPVEWFERPGGACGGQRRSAYAGNSPNGQAPNDDAGNENPPADNPPPSKGTAPSSTPNSDAPPQKNDSSQQ